MIFNWCYYKISVYLDEYVYHKNLQQRKKKVKMCKWTFSRNGVKNVKKKFCWVDGLMGTKAGLKDYLAQSKKLQVLLHWDL